MTVGFYVRNRDEVVVLIDSLATASNDSEAVGLTEKWSEIKIGKRNQGVLVGAGDARVMQPVMQFTRGSDSESVDEALASIRETYTGIYTREVEATGDEFRFQVETIARTLPMSDREKFTAERFDDSIAIGQSVADDLKADYLAVTSQGGLEQHLIVPGRPAQPLHMPYYPVGSGAEPVRRYMNDVLNNRGEMSLGELYFHSLNAFTDASATAGVGGIPSLFYLEPDEDLFIVPVEQNVAMASLSAAFMGGFKPHELTAARAIELFSGIAQEKSDFSPVAEILETTVKALTRLYIPQTSFRHAANEMLKQDTASS